MKSIVFYMLVFSSFVFGQVDSRSKDILLELNKKYGKNTEFEVNVQYNLFKGEHGQVLIDTYSGIQRRKYDLLYTKIDASENIINASYTFSINHEEKSAFLQQNSESADENIKFEELLAKCSASKYLSNKEGDKIRLFFKGIHQMGVKYVEIQLTPSKKEIQKIILLYNSKADFGTSFQSDEFDFPRLEIEFSNYKEKVKNIPNIDHFISKKNGEWIMNSPYVSYRFKSML